MQFPNERDFIFRQEYQTCSGAQRSFLYTESFPAVQGTKSVDEVSNKLSRSNSMPIVSYGDIEKVQRSWVDKTGPAMEKYVEYDDNPLYLLSCWTRILQ
jgi:hypothetical protein